MAQHGTARGVQDTGEEEVDKVVDKKRSVTRAVKCYAIC